MGLAINYKFRRWKDGIVPYKIDKSVLSKSGHIVEGLYHIQEKVPSLKFTEYTGEGDYLLFKHTKNKDASSSKLGNAIGLRQSIKLATWARFGTVVHETCHALGMLHEQQRWDRNDHIDVHWGEVKFWYMSNFWRIAPFIAKPIGEYDYESIMHYGSYAFHKGLNRTITTKEGLNVPGQRKELSEGDIKTLLHMYPLST